MGWLTRVLARVPGLGDPTGPDGTLREAREEIRRLRARLDLEKQKRARLERRLEVLSVRAPDAVEDPASRPLLIFNHLPKTAGTTFRRSYLTAAVRREERWILSGAGENEADRQRFLALPAAKRRRYRIVAGHHAGMLRPFLPEARFLTVVREPVARTISEYLHAMYHPGAAAEWAAERREGMTLGTYVERHDRRNVQSRLLLGDAYDTLDDDALGRFLDDHYALVGYTKVFDEFVFLLHVTQGLPLCLYRNRLVRPERATFTPSPADLDLVRRANTVDARLHGLVRERFDARLAALAPETRDKLERWKVALQEFRQRTDVEIEAERLPEGWQEAQS